MISSLKQQRYAILRSYSIYRFSLAAILLSFVWAGVAPELIGQLDDSSFIATTYQLTAVSLIALISVLAKQYNPSDSLIVFWLLIDTALVIALINSSGGLNSSLVPLFMVIVVVGAILLKEQLSFLIAAFAVIGLYTIVLLHPLDVGRGTGWFTIAAWGTGFFGLSWAGRVVAARLRRSQELEASQSIIISELLEINQRVITRMNTGVVVFDNALRPQLINPSAMRLLNVDDRFMEKPLDIEPLKATISHWRADSSHYSSICHISETVSLRIGLVSLSDKGETLAFIEDDTRIQQQVQQLKLASLGRLTASIAHEIRNPVGAISYARGLLAESSDLVDSDRQLLEVIERQEKRIDRIIRKTFELSRHDDVSPEEIDICEFLTALIDEYQQLYSLDNEQIKLTYPTERYGVEFDRDHLRQILLNLLDNGRNYGSLPINISCRTFAGALIIDVTDQGIALSDDDREKIFEPFYTTSDSGSGMGLFICQQLAQVNKAYLNYGSLEGHSRFSIVISNWSKQPHNE